MAELLLELYNEEIPPQLQISARNQLKQFLKKLSKKKTLNIKKYQLIHLKQDLLYLLKVLLKKLK